jgi:hypothetical protein
VPELRKLKRPKPLPFHNRARRGFRGYPVATVAFYGPDDRKATKMVVGIVHAEGGEPNPLLRWFSEEEDLRNSRTVLAEARAALDEHVVKSVVTVDRIVGCPHEEGIDYPEGETCPQCPFWASRDRWTGESLREE